MKAVALALLCAVSLTAAAQESLLVISKRDRTLAVVDPVTLKVRVKLPTGPDPHEVITSPDGHTAWISNYGSGSLHTLAVLDLLRNKALPPVDLGPLGGPHGLTYQDGTWFTAEGAKVVGHLDPKTGKVDTVIGTGQARTHMIYISPNGKHIITTNVASGTVSLIDQRIVPVPANAPVTVPPQQPRIDWDESVIPVGAGDEGFDISPDGHEVWTANATDGTVSVIDWVQRKVVATIKADVLSANRLKFTLDGKYVLVSLLGAPDLVVIDAKTRAVVKRIPIGTGAAGIQMEPNGKRVFVACTPDNYVAVIDLNGMKVTGHLDVGPEPDGMTWTKIH